MEREFTIRERITKLNERDRTEDATSGETDNLRCYHRGQLEGSYRGNQGELAEYYAPEERFGDTREQGAVEGVLGTDSADSNGYSCKTRSEIDGFGEESGEEIRGSTGETEETGWEYERAVCFGIAEDSGDAEEVYEESYVDSSDSGLSITDGIELGLDVLSLIGGGTTNEDENKKKTHVVHESKDRDPDHGPKMSM